MKPARNGQPINMVGWDLLRNDYYSYVRIGRTQNFELVRESRQTEINIKTHRRKYNAGDAPPIIITVRSLFLFNRGPYLQLWREGDVVIEFDKENIFSVAGQKDYNRSFLDENMVWQILESEEYFKVAFIERLDTRQIKRLFNDFDHKNVSHLFTGFMMHVVDVANVFIARVRMPPIAVIQEPIRPEQDMD